MDNIHDLLQFYAEALDAFPAYTFWIFVGKSSKALI